MPSIETAARLSAFAQRGAGTDAERRAALFLAQEARAGRRDAAIETFWCRPNWAAAHAWHCALAIAGSIVMTFHAVAGGALVAPALLFLVADGLTGRSPGRWLTRRRASQNVVSPAPPGSGGRVRLIVTANYDAGRAGLVHRDLPRRATARLRVLLGRGRFSPGWLGSTAIACAWLIVVAVLRDRGAGGTAVGAVQLIPTAALIVELALLLELAAAPFGPAAGDNASGAALALSLVRALDAAPPSRLAVELLLQGAGDGDMAGVRHHLRAHRRELRAPDTVVLGIAACGTGRPSFWVSDGPLVPLRYHHRLRALAAAVGGAAPHRGRGTTPALPARARGLPALAVGCLDGRGHVLRSRQAGDVATALDARAMDELLRFALTLVDALDAELARTAAGDAASTAAAARAAA